MTPDKLSRHQDGQFQTEFVDPEMKEKFKRYHHKMAQLRMIKARLNLRLGGSERITPSRRPVVIPSDG